MRAKYMDVYYRILNKIEKGDYPPLSKIPSEGELMEEYQVSKDTIRKALALLEQNGYIQKSKGKAAIVLDYNRMNFPVSGLTSYKELVAHNNWVSKTYVEEFKIVNGDPEVMKRLDLTAAEDAYVLIRVREINGERIILDKDYINRKYAPNLTRQACENSIYEYLEREVGLKISFARKEITVRPCTEEDTKLLDLKGYDMVVIIKSFVYLEDASLFQYTESRHRPDKFSFVDFARRTPAI